MLLKNEKTGKTYRARTLYNITEDILIAELEEIFPPTKVIKFPKKAPKMFQVNVTPCVTPILKEMG